MSVIRTDIDGSDGKSAITFFAKSSRVRIAIIKADGTNRDRMDFDIKNVQLVNLYKCIVKFLNMPTSQDKTEILGNAKIYKLRSPTRLVSTAIVSNGKKQLQISIDGSEASVLLDESKTNQIGDILLPYSNDYESYKAVNSLSM